MTAAGKTSSTMVSCPGRRLAAVLVASFTALAATPTAANTYRILLGGAEIGELNWTPGRISSVISGTPLGAADGRFVATISDHDYLAVSEERRIAIRFRDGRPVIVDIDPEDERTRLSDPTLVPANTIDPVTGFARLAEATDCPAPFRMYDGRRVIEIATASREIDGTELVCGMTYEVVAGPGHVSPFRLESLRLTARYAISDRRVAGLARVTVRAGPFAVTLAR